MDIIIKFFQKDFSDEESKVAYLKSCKWLATNIVSKEVEIGKSYWNVSKLLNADLPTFRLELYTKLDAEEGSKSFCARCKEFHSLFYLNQQYNCDACNYIAFKKQMKEKLIIKKELRKERLNHILNE